MSFGYGTKEQLDQQWKDLEADKQEALARIRAEKAEKLERQRNQLKIQPTCHNREVLTLRGGDFFVSAHEPRIGERWRLGAHARGEKSCEMT